MAPHPLITQTASQSQHTAIRVRVQRVSTEHGPHAFVSFRCAWVNDNLIICEPISSVRQISQTSGLEVGRVDVLACAGPLPNTSISVHRNRPTEKVFGARGGRVVSIRTVVGLFQGLISQLFRSAKLCRGGQVPGRSRTRFRFRSYGLGYRGRVDYSGRGSPLVSGASQIMTMPTR